MTQKSTFRITALAAILSLGATGAFAGADPASPTPIVPSPPPPLTTVPAVTLTPGQVVAAQNIVQIFSANPPASIPAVLQSRVVSVLQQVLASPALLAQLGFTPAQIAALIAQVEAIPTT
ncbi:MAG: hypothetical protein JJU40_04930 [Rhodobacteraceae bacterium]|nr:hypothetical protein [Paracoccaceae bacterium]